MMGIERITVLGVSATAPGQQSKAGKPMNRGQLHVACALAPAWSEGGIEKGSAGLSYECDPELVRRIAHLPFPLLADVELQSLNRFGDLSVRAVDCKPVQSPAKP